MLSSAMDMVKMKETVKVGGNGRGNGEAEGDGDGQSAEYNEENMMETDQSVQTGLTMYMMLVDYESKARQVDGESMQIEASTWLARR